MMMLTLYAGCGANLDSPAPIPEGDDAAIDAMALKAAQECRQHLIDCPCGAVRVSLWALGRLLDETTLTTEWVGTHDPPV